MAIAVSHIAGLDVTVNARFLRQRCAWCDEVLIDYDLALVMVALNPDGSHPGGPSGFPVGQLVRREGALSVVLDEEPPLPDDFCGFSVNASPEDFAGPRCPTCASTIRQSTHPAHLDAGGACTDPWHEETGKVAG